MKRLLLVTLLATNVALADDHTKPPAGVITPTSVRQLCVSGYTATIRPPVSYTNKLKAEWTPAGHKSSEYELDHFIPLALGGDPKDPDNLWMQVWSDARNKDILESSLHREVCNGKMSLEDAQEHIRNWR